MIRSALALVLACSLAPAPMASAEPLSPDEVFAKLHHPELGDVDSVRSTIARIYGIEPQNCELRAWTLQLLVDLEDEEGAAAVAQAYEEACGNEKETWRRLEVFYAGRADIKNQIRCGERYLRMGGTRD